MPLEFPGPDHGFFLLKIGDVLRLNSCIVRHPEAVDLVGGEADDLGELPLSLVEERELLAVLNLFVGFLVA
jgi:hypothetical protein